MSDLFGPSKDDLRKNLPLREVASQLTKHYSASGPYILVDGTALCPLHEDQTESFYLWDGDDGLERWWCQPCGVGGDIFDLIRRVLKCSFPESVEIAQAMWGRMPPGYVPPAPAEKKHLRESLEQWYTTVDNARAYAATKPGIFAVMLKLVPNDHEHREEATEWDRHIRETWQWGMCPPEGGVGGGTVRGNFILMPHWNEKGEFTGCKTRNGPQKGSLPGSKYTALYGAWLGRRHRNVLLVEGESDAVYASYVAAKEGIAVDVFGLPAGAGRPPMQEHADFLRGSGTIYLAFDPDTGVLSGGTKGVEATRTWVDFLAKQGFNDIRVCSLPLDIDLRDAKPNLQDLLDRAKLPLKLPAKLSWSPMGYQHDVGRGTDDNGAHVAEWVPVTNWTIEPIARLHGGEEGFDVVVDTRKTRFETVIHLADLADVRTLVRWANNHGLIFTGADSVRKLIAEWVEAQGSVLPVIYQTEQVGAHAAPADYAFAGETFVYGDGYLGKLPWRYALGTKQAPADVSDRILLPTDAEFDWTWLEAFLALSKPSVTHPILAWTVAAMRRHTVRNFPLLYIGGSSGVGKSTLARLAMGLAGSGIEVNLGAVTPFVLTKTLAATTNIPVFVDEWTLLSRKDTLEHFQGAIPLLYAGERAERGQADLSMVTYRMTSPVIIAGEQELTLDRELDRMVTVFPSRGAQNSQALALIEAAPLESFAKTMHNFLLRADEEVIRLTQSASTRPAYNEAVLRDGWRILSEFVEAAHIAGEDVPEIPAEPDLSCFTIQREEREESGNTYDEALLTGLPLKDANAIPLVWADIDGRGTFVRVRELLGLLKTRNLSSDLPGGERALIRYFEERYTVTRERDVRPTNNGTHVRAHLIHDLHLTPILPDGLIQP